MAKLRSRHLKEAKSRRFEDHEDFFRGKSKDEIIDDAWKAVKRYNYRVVYRSRKKTSVTMAFTLYLGKGFEQKGRTDKAGLLWHEIVHMRQWRKLTGIFALRYAFDARYRWAYEIQGYRQQFRVWRALGVSRKIIYRNIAHLQSSFRGPTYRMTRINSSQMKRETKKAIVNGLRDLE